MINPWYTCAARVAVLGVCLSVLCVDNYYRATGYNVAYEQYQYMASVLQVLERYFHEMTEFKFEKVAVSLTRLHGLTMCSSPWVYVPTAQL